MRIISQKGQSYFDASYEKCIIWLKDSIVNVIPLGEPDSNYTFAIYSTKEKALKAMEMLHKAYVQSKAREGIFLYKNVFQFPQEDEL